MADKSLVFFQRRLTESVTDNVNFYKGSDFKEYVESRISRMVQREMENWVASYSPHVDQLLRAMEQEISRGLTYHFNQSIRVETTGGELKTRCDVLRCVSNGHLRYQYKGRCRGCGLSRLDAFVRHSSFATIYQYGGISTFAKIHA